MAATMTVVRKSASKTAPGARRAPAPRVPRALRARVEPLLLENYAFMDSPVFRRRGIERELFDEGAEPALPLTAWYQPTRDEAIEEGFAGAPQLMRGAEERLIG